MGKRIDDGFNVWMEEETDVALERLTAEIGEKHALVRAVETEVAKILIGQRELVTGLLIGLFTKGHILIEGVPGLAKTSAVKALADAVHADFKRIQFTPDLLPADLVGTEVYRPKTGDFDVKKGPIFHNIILADEINRAPSKVQSALLEAMQERQVTIGETTFPLPDPFLVLATQNPIEQEGTYPLPEAQVDRFMLKVLIGYPTREEERAILDRIGFEVPAAISRVLTPAQIDEIAALIAAVHVDDKIKDYIVDLVFASRQPGARGLEVAPYIQFGASPRATIFLGLAARATAFLQGRAYVTPQDVKTAGPAVLRHRIILTYEAEAEDVSPDRIVQGIFDAVEVP
jgi:MoxR-like ATPase